MVLGGETVRDPGPPPVTLQVRVVSAEDLAPVEGAEVTFDGESKATGPTGTASVIWYERSITVRARAAGFVPERLDVVELPEEGPVQLALTPVIITGTVRTVTGDPVEGATISLNGSRAVTDAEGNYRLIRAIAGLMTVTRAAWESDARPWNGRSDSVDFVISPMSIRGIRVNSPNAGNPSLWSEFLEMAEGSAINALVLDTKDEAGEVPYNTAVTTAHEIGAVKVRYDVEELLADMRRNDLYAITRIVTFQDNPMATAHPEWAAVNINTGGVWRSNRGQAWMDPTDRGSWEYPLELAIEACQLGFDEIQFDYVRFPSDGPVEALSFDGGNDEQTRVTTIAAFLTEARNRLNPLGCAVAADVFAVTISSLDDQGIGQKPEELSKAVDVLSPMIYPTHYTPGWDGFANPNDHPAEIVGGSLDDGLPRMQGSAIMRPWLQTSTYGPTQVEMEIQEARERRLGWMLWQSVNLFDPRDLPNQGFSPPEPTDTSSPGEAPPGAGG